MPDVYISDLPTGVASGSQYLAQDNGTTTSKVTVSDAVGASDLATLVGSTAMGTTATTVTGAIAEHEGDISAINSNIISHSAASEVTFVSGVTSSNSYNIVYQGDLIVFHCQLQMSAAHSGDYKILTFGSTLKPFFAESYSTAIATDGTTRIVTVTKTSSGADLFLYNPEAKHYYFSIVYTK